MDEKMIETPDIQKIDWKENILSCIKVFFTFAIILGIIYPFVITLIAQTTMPYQANGSFIMLEGKIIGSEKIAQKFEGDKYFHSRPSSVDYDASASGASNLGPNSNELKKIVKERIKNYRNVNKIDTKVNIPSDAVTASASGLDPNITIDNAKLQIRRIALSRNLSENVLEKIVMNNIDKDFIGIWGKDSVNVLKLNAELDKMESDKKGN